MLPSSRYDIMQDRNRTTGLREQWDREEPQVNSLGVYRGLQEYSSRETRQLRTGRKEIAGCQQGCLNQVDETGVLARFKYSSIVSC